MTVSDGYLRSCEAFLFVVLLAQLLSVGINSVDFPDTRREIMSIQIPPELVQIIAGSSGMNGGLVRAVSFLYYSVQGLFPSGRPGESK